MKRITLLLLATVLLIPTAFLQKNGYITGKIVDEKTGEDLIGVSVMVKGNTKGTATDIDGTFKLEVAPGIYDIQISYISYQTKIIEKIEVVAGQVNEPLHITMAETVSELGGYTVQSEALKGTSTALIIEQKNSAVMFDGISSDQMRKTPDRTTSDVLKRISGATIQDNFVVIRGLPDRYNAAYLNGAALPSSEPDRKAFSFDIFPSALLSDLKVIKTAMPSLPGEFAGGIIQVRTKDIPEKNYYQFSLGVTFDLLTTFQNYQSTAGGSTDFFGIDDGTRLLPKGVPTNEQMNFYQINFMKDTLVHVAKMFNNNYAVQSRLASPGTSFQFSMGHNANLVAKSKQATYDGKFEFGSVFALIHTTRVTYRKSERNDYDLDNLFIHYDDELYNTNTTWGALWNLSLLRSKKNGANNKIGLKNLFNVNSNDQFLSRTGQDIVNGADIKAYNSFYSQNILVSTQLVGEHVLPTSKIRFDWGIGYNMLSRIIPDYRITEYRRALGDTNDVYRIPLSTNVQPEKAGRFFSEQMDHAFSGNFDFTLPFKIKSTKHELKIGSMVQMRYRDFQARQFGYASYKSSGTDVYGITAMGIDTVFLNRNMHSEGLYVREITRASDAYTANQQLIAGYIQLENSLFNNKLKLVWGARVESFRQVINTFDFSSGNPIQIDTNVVDVLPSLNVIYSINDKMNLRISGSQTVCRPESRELAPFTFYDYNLFASVTGNPTLKRTRITNADLRYEWYPKGGQLISGTVFFKYFENPIEKVLFPAGSIRIFSYINVPSAYAVGGELEYRFSIGSFIEKKHAAFLDNLSFVGNLALIHSEVNLDSVSGVNERRPMQGQSNYIVNTGIQYNDVKYNFGISLSTNIIGPRIFSVGNVLYGNIWENPRFVMDLQLSKSFMKRKLELILNFRDLIAPTAYFYQDNDGNRVFDEKVDNKMIARNMGQQISFSVSYKF